MNFLVRACALSLLCLVTATLAPAQSDSLSGSLYVGGYNDGYYFGSLVKEGNAQLSLIGSLEDGYNLPEAGLFVLNMENETFLSLLNEQYPNGFGDYGSFTLRAYNGSSYDTIVWAPDQGWYPISVVPEPSTWMLLIAASATVLLLRKTRRAQG